MGLKLQMHHIELLSKFGTWCFRIDSNGLFNNLSVNQRYWHKIALQTPKIFREYKVNCSGVNFWKWVGLFLKLWWRDTCVSSPFFFLRSKCRKKVWKRNFMLFEFKDFNWMRCRMIECSKTRILHGVTNWKWEEHFNKKETENRKTYGSQYKRCSSPKLHISGFESNVNLIERTTFFEQKVKLLNIFSKRKRF